MRRKPEESQIVLALQAIRSDPSISIRKAAEIYNVSHATLARRVKGTLDAITHLRVGLYAPRKRKSLLSISSSLTPKDFPCDTRIYEIWPIDPSAHVARHP